MSEAGKFEDVLGLKLSRAREALREQGFDVAAETLAVPPGEAAPEEGRDRVVRVREVEEGRVEIVYVRVPSEPVRQGESAE